MGCCNSKPKKKAPKKVAAPVVAAAKPAVVAERPKDIPAEDPRIARLRALQAARRPPFRYAKCAVPDGAVSVLLPDGVVFRVEKDGAWFVYNDSLEYEAHLKHVFPAGAALEAGERTALEEAADGGQCARLVVHPLETLHYVSGAPEEFRGEVAARPLGEAFHAAHSADANAAAADALAAAKATAREGADDEAVLAACVASGTAFTDPDFPPTPHMLQRPEVDGHVVPAAAMLRPAADAPEGPATLFTGAVVPQALEAGLLGDCWFTGAVAALAGREGAVRAAFAGADPAESARGGYRVWLSKHGWWRHVIVDDFLPTIAGVPVFARSADPRELWPALLQKAYAKLHGSYAAITGGDALHALQDLTGAPAQRFDDAWAAAAADPDAAAAFLDRLAAGLAAGCLIVLSTPSHNTLADPAPDRARLAAVGLELSQTYRLQDLVRTTAADGSPLALLKVCNPWAPRARWTGAWAAGSADWAENPAAAEACGEKSRAAAADPDAVDDGTFWIAFEDAVAYFNGGGVVYTLADAVDYRVRGAFHGVEPSVVLKVTASTRPVELLLVLSQPDKRGRPIDDPAARLAPLMLSVAKYDAGRFRVERNSGADVDAPTADYRFAVARDVAVRYTFEPSPVPYLVIPRLHGKGVVDGFDRPFVLGVLSAGPVDDALSLEFTHLPADHPVFQNLRTFAVDRMPLVEAAHQRHLAGEPLAAATSTRACGAATGDFVPPVIASTSSSSSFSSSSPASKPSSGLTPGEDGAAAVEVVEADVDAHTHHASDQDTKVHRVD